MNDQIFTEVSNSILPYRYMTELSNILKLAKTLKCKIIFNMNCTPVCDQNPHEKTRYRLKTTNIDHAYIQA